MFVLFRDLKNAMWGLDSKLPMDKEANETMFVAQKAIPDANKIEIVRVLTCLDE